ncbi:MAG: indole-3-glycerol phosphate synthase TrpC [Chloroflexota bacterium]
MILERIVADNRPELAARQRAVPLDEVRRRAAEQAPPLDFGAALRREGVSLIAEVKKASPSRGVIRADFDPVAIARTYAANGAAAISVLTEARHFQGSLDYLKDIRKALGGKLPLLRKDFIHDPYQVYEARACGADALLLIVAMLTPERLRGLLNLSHGLGMGCLVEVHDEAELAVALASGAGIIGINNRDLKTFAVDLATTGRLRPLVPPGRTVVSESGIKSPDDMARMRVWGVDAVLVGETLMAAPDIAAKMKELR